LVVDIDKYWGKEDEDMTFENANFVELEMDEMMKVDGGCWWAEIALILIGVGLSAIIDAL